MAKRIRIIAVLLMISLCGCDDGTDVAQSNGGSALEQPLIEAKTTEGIDGTTQQSSTKILIPPKGEIHYTEAELQMVEDALNDREGAQKIMRQTNGFGIYNIVRADVLSEEDDMELEVETADREVYVLHFGGMYFHIYAIEKAGEYIYMEIE